MKSVTQIKSLSDVRTSISTHARAAPRQNGATFIEIYLLDKEKHRLEAELALLTKRQRRIEARIAAIGETLKEVARKFQKDGSPLSRSAAPKGENPAPDPLPKPRTMTVEY